MIGNLFNNITFVCPRHSEALPISASPEYQNLLICSDPDCKNSVKIYHTEKVFDKLLNVAEKNLQGTAFIPNLTGTKLSFDNINVCVMKHAPFDGEMVVSLDNLSIP